MTVDVNQPLENPVLKELFTRRRAAQSDSECVEVMNQLAEEIVMNAHFLSVIQLSEEPDPQASGEVVLKKDSTMVFPMLSTQDGKRYYPAFIDWEELGRWEDMRATRPKTLIMSFDDYAALSLDNEAGGDGVAINPFSDNLVLNRSTLEQWRGRKEMTKTGHTEQRVTKDTPVRIGTPKDYPHTMVKAMVDFAKRQKRIRALWLRLMEKEGETSLLVVADFEGDRQALFGGLANAAKPYLCGMYLDMVPYETDFGHSATDGSEPFYKKKFSLFSK